MPVIVKGDGTRESFDIGKLTSSLSRSGAPQQEVWTIAESIARMVKDGMTTSDIYRAAFKALHKRKRALAARYSLRRALLEMGPTGYPFEDYFAELMRARGFDAKTRQIIEGRCAPHEVDVVLKKRGVSIGAELKFHNAPGFKTDIKTALYVRARYTDIEDGAKDRNEQCEIREVWLVTNTKFTDHAIRYAQCSGVKLLGWSFPKEENLADIIQETGLYPVTVLTSTTKKEEALLLAQGITLCRSIAADPERLQKTGISKHKYAAIVAESAAVCGV